MAARGVLPAVASLALVHQGDIPARPERWVDAALPPTLLAVGAPVVWLSAQNANAVSVEGVLRARKGGSGRVHGVGEGGFERGMRENDFGAIVPARRFGPDLWHQMGHRLRCLFFQGNLSWWFVCS